MSETRSTFLTRRARYLCIAGAFILLALVFFAYRRQPVSDAVLTVKVVPVEETVGVVDFPVVDFDSESYYRPILEYNLFRPLGWTPPIPVEPYRLVGTVLPRGTERPPQAIIEGTGGGNPQIVSVGDSLDGETTVVGIESDSVVLESGGESRTLTLGGLVYLNRSGSGRVASRSTPSPVRRTSVVGQPRRVSPIVPSQDDAPVSRSLPYSGWQTSKGERIRFGDARLKNPAKWGLRRR